MAGPVALVGLVVAHLVQGRAGVGVDDVADWVRGAADPRIGAVIEGSRLPRTVAALAVGAALGLAGLLLQSATRNRLAEPGTIGVSAGAFLAVVIATLVGFGGEGYPRGAIALVGGTIAGIVVLGAGGRESTSSSRLILAGVSFGLAASSAAAALLVIFEQELGALFLWGYGSLVQNGYDRLRTVAPLLAIGLIGSILLAGRLDVLGLGDDAAAGLGGRPRTTRAIAAAFGVLLTSAAVAVAGPIGFIGLVAPAIARATGAHRHRALIVLSVLWGAVLMVAADVATQLLRGDATANEMPVGVTTALLGAPALILLARTTSAGGTPPSGLGGRVRRRPPFPVAVGIGLGLLAVAFVWGLTAGDLDVPISKLGSILAGGGDALLSNVVMQLRLPRLVVAGVAGAALAVAGASLQAITRNPLADPSVMGVTGGAAVGALTLLFVVPDAAPGLVPVGAFVGALVATVVVLACAGGGGLVPERLALVGIAVAAFTAAVVDVIVVHQGLRLAQALVWLSGSTYARSAEDARALAAWTIVLIPAIWLCGRKLDLLALGEDLPRSLGLRVGRTRAAIVVLASLLAGAAVATVGTIGFVGLIGPHLVRRVAGPNTRHHLVLTALCGATLVVIADVVGRTALAPKEIPTGLVVSLIGAPFFLQLVARTRDT